MWLPPLICDFVLIENFCNLNCHYCSPGWGKITLREDHFYWVDKNALNLWKSLRQLQKEWVEIAEHVSKRINPPIIKLSGGEIFLIPDIEEVIKSIAGHANILQVLTNGTILNSKLASSLSSIDKLHYQISIDGHLPAMNALRFNNPSILKKVLSFLDFAAQSSNTVEINCVITKHSIDDFFGFAEFTASKYDNVVIVPFPVRGFQDYSPTPDQVILFEKRLIDYQTSCLKSLPPFPYLFKLLEFMKVKKRKNRCFLPLFAFSAYGNGKIQFCTCGGDYSVGDILHDNILNIGKKIYKTFQKIDRLSNIHSYCRDCFTHYDMINLFIQDELTAKDLEGFSIFTNELVINMLNDLKNNLKREGFN